MLWDSEDHAFLITVSGQFRKGDSLGASLSTRKMVMIIERSVSHTYMYLGRVPENIEAVKSVSMRY